MSQVYFDNAATTPVRNEVITAMTYVIKNNFGNPSSSHSFGRSSKSIVESCRKSIAEHFKVSAGEIIFTSGGTEADNLVLRSAVRDLKVTHVITAKTEHHAVLHMLDELKKEFDIEVSFVQLDSQGGLDYEHFEKLLSIPKKTLVSLMHVNNEIGNLIDVRRIGELCYEANALFHTDAVQSVGHYKIDLKDIKIDFLAASAHKFHGPKGVGFTFIRRNTGLRPLIFGGEQERGLRAGTESVHNIVGLEKALSMAYSNLDEEKAYVEGLKAYFIEQIKKEISGVSFNGNSGDLDKSTYTLVNVCLPVKEQKAAMFLFQMDLKGIACSKGSACQSGSSQNSHVLAEILSETDLKKPSIRFSFSIYNTREEIDYVIGVLKELIED